MSIRRIRAMAKKEIILVRRDIRVLIAAIFMPMMLILLFGYALSLDVDNIPTLVLDLDQTPASRDLVRRLADSRYFTIVRHIHRQAEIEPALARREALMTLVIPADFSARVSKGVEAPVQVIFDGTDSNTTTIASGYFTGIANRFNLSRQMARIRKAGLRLSARPLDPRIRVWFNPELKSRNFIIPGLSAVIMMVICALMTALTISREKETGTMEQLVSTPITGSELVLGKLLPYLGLGLIEITLVVVAGVLIFGVPFRGSYLNLLLVSLIFMAGTLSWGLLISAVARNQMEASQMVILSAFLPSFLLSGFIYPIENMPLALQVVTYIVPARYFVEIAKGLFLKGVGLDVLWPQVLFLAAYGFVTLNLARKLFSKRIA
ncbi:MAG: ABC transporter permease [Deltaproteobacteria bacterium]|nr:ABC transporter permease [Deltaproteobacteria bacterium]MBW2085714.1 ABC transporter permease [Deltaproteobacteria bacterium]